MLYQSKIFSDPRRCHFFKKLVTNLVFQIEHLEYCIIFWCIVALWIFCHHIFPYLSSVVFKKSIISLNFWPKHSFNWIFVFTTLEPPETWNFQHSLGKYSSLFPTIEIRCKLYMVPQNFWFYLFTREWWKVYFIQNQNPIYFGMLEVRKKYFKDSTRSNRLELLDSIHNERWFIPF